MQIMINAGTPAEFEAYTTRTSNDHMPDYTVRGGGSPTPNQGAPQLKKWAQVIFLTTPLDPLL